MLTSTTTLSLPRRRYPLRRSPSSRKRTVALHVDTDSAERALHASGLLREADARPVLMPLHPNLRRLPSRIFSEKFTAETQDPHMNVQVGSKRKRVASGSNENVQTSSRSMRAASGRTKRPRRSRHSDLTSDEDETSSMDLDDSSHQHWPTRREESSEDAESDEEEEEEEEESSEGSEGDSDDNSTDDHLISSASSRVLKRLRKQELLRLYNLTGLTDDAEDWNKSEIADAIVNAREDIASLPPSSPPGREGSSDYSSDDVMPSDDEESTPRYLKRRATTNNIEHLSSSRPFKSRSLSMGHLDSSDSPRSKKKTKSKDSSGSNSRRSNNSRSSPTPLESSAAYANIGFSVSSPPAHHLRSRKVSAPSIATRLFTPHDSSGTSLANFTFGAHAPNNRKGKAKQVDFDESTIDFSASRSPSKRSCPQNTTMHDSESDLTELDVLESKMKPSPRRTRSKDKERPTSSSQTSTSSESFDARRVTPMRKAKGKITSLKEDSELSELTTTDEEGEDDDRDANRDEDEMDEDEVDELVSVASGTPSPMNSTRRTPLRKRLRPRKGADHTDPSDGDDEHEEEDEDAEGDDELDEDEDDEGTIAVEPRRLRNGKIVGDEDVDMDEEDIGEEDIGEEEDEEEDEIGEQAEEGEDGEEAEEDAEAEEDEGEEEAMEDEGEEEEAMEDENDVDLTVATARTLVRLRRDDLVRLCESRDLEPVGTKPQLAEALLQWRDRQANDFSSPSSTGTVRPPTTVRRRTRRRFSDNSTTTVTPPVLLRSDRVHLDEPRTPPKSAQPEKAVEPELELDLGTLGLEDREIPPEKLQKLEKIGSGGFKDVFIGKFKGRKIAISEFRGQLSPMDVKELKLLGGFDHPNIVRFLGVSIPENTKETPVMIISELCTNGDLFDYIRNVNPPSVYKVLTIMLDIARGLEYLHTRKPSVIHRDCKSSNILITSKGVAKIADFGLAKVKQSTRSMVRSLVGTVNWQAPELWHAHPKYNHKGMNEHAIYEAVGAKKQRPSLTGLRQRWCNGVVDLIERMWAQEHQDRPTMSEVVEELQELVDNYRP
ncbi:hypothetical protein D9758_000770 [Tetrapyrgos nigripes]|uniref:Protein kinase domain-containing protein n=1 Tax=Tetrapyrgos nigripes TaxID=182062 RepID=A0A8H5LY85_9AGAR|nr:hypothetical protein D9758_000770 [Tetrapyrgos nigripes]